MSDARMAVIRDAFLEGRDADAVLTLLEVATEYIEQARGMPELVEAKGFGRPGVWLPLESVPVKPGETGQCFARPQRPFRPTYLFVASACARSFVISSVTFGTTIQGSVSYGDIAADIFSTARRRPLPIAFDPVMPGMDCRVVMRNTSKDEKRFECALWGISQ